MQKRLQLLLLLTSLQIWTLLKHPKLKAKKVEDVVTDAIHTLGENIQLARFAYAGQPEGAVASYIHGGGKIGVLVEFKLGDTFRNQ